MYENVHIKAVSTDLHMSKHAYFLCTWANHLQKMDFVLESGTRSTKGSCN